VGFWEAPGGAPYRLRQAACCVRGRRASGPAGGGAQVLEKLRDLDEVAYIRFASVYLPLGDLEALKREVDRLL
jgi:transcriptional regulator NrdR family protein